MPERLGPPPKKADERFDNWVFRLWKRAFGALNSGDVGVTAPITITTSGTGTLNIGHSTSGVASGTYGSASVIPQVVVDTYGHVTSVGTNAVAISGTSVTGTDLTFTSPILGTATNAVLRGGTIAHATSGVIGGTYGALASVPVFAVNTWGHVTLATSSAIQVAGTQVTGADLTVSSPLTGTATNALLRAGTIGHGTSGVTPGTYGGTGGTFAQVVVDTYGHLTGVSNVDTNKIFRRSYVIPNNSGSAQWISLGTLTIAQLGRHAQIIIDTSLGYNAAVSQNQQINLFFKTSNGSSVDANGFAGDSSWYSTGRNTGVDAIAWIGNAAGVSATAFELRVHLAAFFGEGAFYTVEAPDGSWVHSGAVSTDPGVGSDTVLLSTNEFYAQGEVVHYGVSGVTAGTYGGALGLARVIVDTYGHITAGTSFPLQATTPILVGSNAGTFTWGHSTSGIVPGTFGDASTIPQIVVNTYGHVTAVSTFAVSAGELSNLITGGTTTMGTRGSRVYAHELTLGTDGGMVIPSTSYLAITG